MIQRRGQGSSLHANGGPVLGRRRNNVRIFQLLFSYDSKEMAVMDHGLCVQCFLNSYIPTIADAPSFADTKL